MRMRNKKNADKRLENCGSYLIDSVTLNCINPSDLFDNDNPVHLEIGCGKGGFAMKMALKHPDINFIAVESNKNVMVLAAEKAMKNNLTNLRFILADASKLNEFFNGDSFSRIYLNFSDPWHKKRHAKRRLTYKSFLEIYRQLLTEAGVVQMKTDNVPLFDFSLESFEENGYKLTDVTYDLHSLNEADNVMTEYEELFSSQGHKICRVIAKP